MFLRFFVKGRQGECLSTVKWILRIFCLFSNRNLSSCYDLCVIKDFSPCGRCNQVFNDSRRVPVNLSSQVTTGLTIHLIYTSLCLLKTQSRLCRHCMHSFFRLLSPPSPLLIFSPSNTQTKPTKVSPRCLGG